MERAIADREPVVLIVEDEHLLRMSAVEMVEGAGFEAIEASADEAIRIPESRSDIRAVFTDLDARLNGWPQTGTSGAAPGAAGSSDCHVRANRHLESRSAKWRTISSEAI